MAHWISEARLRHDEASDSRITMREGLLIGSTLFWGGSTFAPSFMVDGQAGRKVNVQEYLQEAFLRAIEKLANAVGDLDSVLGIEVCGRCHVPGSETDQQLMNEPHPGFIGLPTVQEWVGPQPPLAGHSCALIDR